ncbi:MAG: hypothetical protein IKB02_04155 [Clostridia bacterium]|nr:hypothetical protein [Clostridia bacterium]
MKKSKSYLLLLLIPIVAIVGIKVFTFFSEQGAFIPKEEVVENSKWEFYEFSIVGNVGTKYMYESMKLEKAIPERYITAVGESVSNVYSYEDTIYTPPTVTDETGKDIGTLDFDDGNVTLLKNSGEEVVCAKYFKDFITFKDGKAIFCDYSGGFDEFDDSFYQTGIDESLVEAYVEEKTFVVGDYDSKNINIDVAVFKDIEDLECKETKAYIKEGVLQIECKCIYNGFEELELLFVFRPAK